MKHLAALALALCGLCFAGSCADDEPTAIVIFVRENFSALAELQRVEYRVYALSELDAGAEAADAGYAYETTDASRVYQQPWGEVGERPFVLERGRARAVDVHVVGVSASNRDEVESTARVRFIDGKALALRVALAEGCRGVVCEPGYTCNGIAGELSSGACVPVVDGQLLTLENARREPWNPVMIENARPSGESDAGGADASDLDGSAPPSDAATELDGEANCEPLAMGAECVPYDRCSCAEGLHCQVPASGGGATCAPVGSTPRNEGCAGDAECGANLTCVEGVCRALCSEMASCTGECRPLADAGSGPSYCLDSCQLGSACGRDVACVQRAQDLADAGRGACIRQVDCAQARSNGVCEEPLRGTGACEQGSDTEDCCRGRGSLRCDPVENCSCPQGQTCQFSEDGQARCRGARGDGGVGAACRIGGDCAPGFHCLAQATCVKYCRGNGDCPAPSACKPFAVDAGVRIGYCQ